MNDSNTIKVVRERTRRLLFQFRNALFEDSGFSRFPTDKELAEMIGITPTAYSSLSRGCATISGPTLWRVLSLLSTSLSKEHFDKVVYEYVSKDF